MLPHKFQTYDLLHMGKLAGYFHTISNVVKYAFLLISQLIFPSQPPAL